MGHWFRSFTPHVQWPQKHRNVQRALTSDSNRTRRQQLSHCHAVRLYQCHTELWSRSPQGSYFSAHQNIEQPIWFERAYNYIQKGKCSITSPPSCTIAGKLVNGLYFIVPATTLLSLTTKTGRQRKRESSPLRESSPPRKISPPRAPTASITKSTQKSLTITESRLLYWPLAHITSYSHENSDWRI